MNYLQAEKISKSYRDHFLFESLSLSIDKNQKLALIARNGAGKSTLLRILAGAEEPDAGAVNTVQGLTTGYLPQEPRLVDELTVYNQVLFSLPAVTTTLENYETRIKEMLSRLKIDDLEQKIGELSGGQKKRVALATVLVPQPDLLILDEPTNHLDLDMVEWLEEYLGQSSVTLIMVTHDRYFLDRICTEILELNDHTLYRYKGNFKVFLAKRQERLELDQRQSEKASALMKKELEWVNRMPQARGTKAKYRMDAFVQLKEDSKKVYQAEMGDIAIQSSRMGKKVLDLYHLSKSYGDLVLFSDFSYKFQRLEKIGIIGPNGAGKSTFLSVITGLIEPDSGRVDPGATIRFGYYRQEGIDFNPDDKVIDVVRNIAEVIEPGPGRSLSAAQLLEMFLFPRKVQFGLVSKLSGGEKRRLYLLTVLMKNPNFLVLDEPTNDLDILTLEVLEEYLLRFIGCVIIVSHDRYFMDKVVDHLFVFDETGTIGDFPGNYSIYRDQKLLEKEQAVRSSAPREKKIKPKQDQPKTKLSFNERREFESLTFEIAALEQEKARLEADLSSGNFSPDELHRMSSRIGEIISLIDEKELRWLMLSEYEE